MAYYSLFPSKDATLYSHPERKLMNSGRDELLELVKEKHDDQLYYPSRILLAFKNEEVKDAIENVIGSSTFNSDTTVGLNLYQVQNKNLINVLNLEVFAVSQSWDEGFGRYQNLPTSSDGASWVYRDNSQDQTKWPTGSVPTGDGVAKAAIGIHFEGSSPAYTFGTGSTDSITIGGVNFLAVLSSSMYTGSATDNQVFFEESSSLDAFSFNLRDAINASSSLIQGGVTASILEFSSTINVLQLTSSISGTVGNHTITTSSIVTRTNTAPGPFYSITPSSGFGFEGGTDTVGSDLAAGTTGSISSSLLTAGGGSWYTGSGFTATQQFIGAEVLDTNFDVTEIVKKHSASLFASQTYPDGIFNNGFLIKQTDSVEASTSSSFGLIQYFSVDTNTIYPPKLCFKWDDSTHTYQSSAKTSGELSVSLYRNQKEYNQNDIATFRVNVRDKYPTRTFVTSSNYLEVGYLTTSSFYSIRDAHTEEEIIPFDNNYTK